MIKLEPFTQRDFDRLISWVDNAELLMQIAGPGFSFPLTVDQLQKYLDDKNSYAFNVIDVSMIILSVMQKSVCPVMIRANLIKY